MEALHIDWVGVVDAIGYPAFYLYTASLSIPALLLLLLLARRRDFQLLRSAAARAG